MHARTSLQTSRSAFRLQAHVVAGALVVALLSRNARAQVVGTPILRGGSLYYLVGPTTWTDAEQQALGLGGHLATINDQSENDWLFAAYRHVPTGDQRLFFGFTDSANEGTWVWSSGAPVTYMNWGPNEPHGASQKNFGNFHPEQQGTWQDIDSRPGYGIVEVSLPGRTPA